MDSLLLKIKKKKHTETCRKKKQSHFSFAETVLAEEQFLLKPTRKDQEAWIVETCGEPKQAKYQRL